MGSQLLKRVKSKREQTISDLPPWDALFNYNYQCKAGTYLCLRRITGSTSQREDLQKQFREQYHVPDHLFQDHKYTRKDYKNISA